MTINIYTVDLPAIELLLTAIIPLGAVAVYLWARRLLV